MKKRWIVAGLAAGLACFGLGVASSRRAGTVPDVGVSPEGPKIFIDPSSIELLPDASLRLDLPAGFDAGEP